MSRISYNMLKEWINEWNEYHPEMKMRLSVYNDYYHIARDSIGQNIVVEATPGRAWESFTIWKNGYYTGKESVGDDKR